MITPKLVMFDLDGTLAVSKQPLTEEMAGLLAKLMAKTQVAVISGGALPQFMSQVVDQLPPKANLAHLYLLPTSGAALHEYRNGEWKKIYEERLSDAEAEHITAVLREAGSATGHIDFSAPSYGERIEHRGAQVTLSALGQKAPAEEKEAWDPNRTKREAIHAYASTRLPEYSVKFGGATSIDVTKKNIDKAYGIHKLCAHIHIAESDALYVGDQLRPGGNDEAAYKTDIAAHPIESLEETVALIRKLIASHK